jgi:hypothetical protein
MRWSTFAVLLASCASAPDVPMAAGPMRPLAPDVGLDEAVGESLEDAGRVAAWIAARVEHAARREAETVRVPLVRTAAGFVIAAKEDDAGYAIVVTDLTSVGIPPSPWVGWVDGRFSADDGLAPNEEGRPVLVVHRQWRRTTDEKPVLKVRPGVSP